MKPSVIPQKNPKSGRKTKKVSPKVSPGDSLAEMRDKMLRHAAEAENLRRRHVRELEQERKYAAAKLAAAILPVADNLERAISNMQEAAVAAHRTGIESALRDFHRILAGFSIKPIEIKAGAAFDPNFHQAVSEQPNPNLPKGAVLAVAQTGYVIEDRLLRPAMVVVSGGK